MSMKYIFITMFLFLIMGVWSGNITFNTAHASKEPTILDEWDYASYGHIRKLQLGEDICYISKYMNSGGISCKFK